MHTRAIAGQAAEFVNRKGDALDDLVGRHQETKGANRRQRRRRQRDDNIGTRLKAQATQAYRNRETPPGQPHIENREVQVLRGGVVRFPRGDFEF